MMPYYGDIAEDATIDIYFNTYTSNDPSASSTITNFANTDVHIHKDGGLTQRNNAAGITVSVDFDGITGTHLVKIDTSNDTVAAFWVTGSDYMVRIEGTTIDGATINAGVATFSIENRFKEVDLTHIMGTILTEGGAGRLAAAFIKFLDVATPALVASAVMRGTDSANTTVPDAAGVAPTAAEVVNEWESQSQADPTGFHVNTREWLDQPVTLSTGNKPDVNINEVSDDSTAADDLELFIENAKGTDHKALISTDAQDLNTTLSVNTKAISGSTATADNVESVFLGTGHTDNVDLSARKLKLDSDTDVALEILSSDDSAIKAVSTASGKHGMELAGNVAGDGLSATGGTTGDGIHAVGGATSGSGIMAEAATEGDGIYALAKGTDEHGIYAVGGDTTGSGIKAEAAISGDGLLAVGATNGHGLNADGAGTGEGINATGGATGNGIEATGGATSGAGIKASAQNNNDAGMELVKNGSGADLDADDLASYTSTRAGYIDNLNGHTAQGADNNTILAHANYGNAQLVRSTVPANALDVSATGEAGLDFANIKDATGAHTLTHITVPAVTTTTTNTDMRGTDSAATAAKLLAYVQLLARNDAAIETDNATELTAINADGGTGAGNYSAQTDSIEAIRDRGDNEWITATGFNTTTPDAAGTASSLHTTTNSKVDAIPTTAMRGTDNAATSSALTTAQNDLNTITGSDGVTLATAQGKYAPAKAGDAMTLSSGAVTAAVIATDAIDDDAIKADAVTAIQSGLATGTNVTSAHSTTDALVSGLNDPTSAAIATAVMAKVVDETLDVTEALKIIVAVLAGDMAKSSNTYTYDEQDGSVKLTEVVSASAVARTIA